jgi:hypothetical protein
MAACNDDAVVRALSAARVITAGGRGRGQLVRQARQSLLLPAKAATSSRAARASAPAIKQLSSSGRLGFPPRAPTTDSCFARFTDGRCALRFFPGSKLSTVLPRYISIRSRLPRLFFSHRGGLAHSYLLSLFDLDNTHHNLPQPGRVEPSLCTRTRQPFSPYPRHLIVALSPTCRPTTMLSGLVPALPLSGRSRLSA